MFTEKYINDEAFISGHLVLILGQDRETRLLMKTLLELWNYRVIEARNVREAIRKSKKHCPGTILFDADSSSGDFSQDLNEIRRNELFRSVPVIIISSYATPAFRELTMANGANHFFTKPLNYSRFETSLSEYAAHRDNAAGDYL